MEKCGLRELASQNLIRRVIDLKNVFQGNRIKKTEIYELLLVDVIP